MRTTHLRAVRAALLVFFTTSCFTVQAFGQAKSPINQYRSRHFIVNTDASPKEAKELLTRLETMLGLIAGYWGRPPSAVIESYVVKDLKNWPQGSMPADAYGMVADGGGLTISRGVPVGKGFAVKAVAYAVLERGVPQHEAVHAFCRQTFGHVGPTWYSEGMAEMGNYWREGKTDVHIEPVVMQYLQQSKPRSLREIVAPDQGAGTWQDYAWRWALCHLLANNPNYAPRFRPLGMGFITGQPVSFEQTYGAMASEISFEYLFFLEHLEQGLEASLIAWDWKKKFLPLKHDKKTVRCRVQARRGWQPTGLTVTAGHEYSLEAEGTWKLTEGGESLSADGDAEGNGSLTGVLMKDWKLGQPFRLGAEGRFVAPGDGDLYLRCQDGWIKIGDNSGVVSVKLGFVTGTPENSREAVFVSTRPQQEASPGETASELRTWTDSSGKFSVKASLVSATAEQVRLRTAAGKFLNVPIAKLSSADQEYLASRE